MSPKWGGYSRKDVPDDDDADAIFARTAHTIGYKCLSAEGLVNRDEWAQILSNEDYGMPRHMTVFYWIQVPHCPVSLLPLSFCSLQLWCHTRRHTTTWQSSSGTALVDLATRVSDPEVHPLIIVDYTTRTQITHRDDV